MGASASDNARKGQKSSLGRRKRGFSEKKWGKNLVESKNGCTFALAIQKWCLRQGRKAILKKRRRGVAQPGSAPVLGTGGRRFESCRPDFFLRWQAFTSVKQRGVAQPGSAPVLGTGGRRFESCRPDFFLRWQAFTSVKQRGVAQPGSAPVLGTGGRRFESCRPDFKKARKSKVFLAFLVYARKGKECFRII